MATSHVISALTTKRGELIGSIRHYKQLISSLDKDLATIDATIKIFEPDFSFRETKIVNTHRNQYFERGKAKTLILDILRQSNTPMRSDDILKIIADKNDISLDNSFEKRNFQKSITNALSNLERSNLIQRVGKEGLTIIWKIKELE